MMDSYTSVPSNMCHQTYPHNSEVPLPFFLTSDCWVVDRIITTLGHFYMRIVPSVDSLAQLP